MSDFVFSSVQRPQGELTLHIQSIYQSDPPEVREFHGAWGSLGVSYNLYKGFQPLETEQHVFVVIGGPVLYFRDNCFLTQSDPIAGTKVIYERWLKGKMLWDEDLSGPFALLLVDKDTKNVTYVTDLMSFIPVYRCKTSNSLMLGTHVDALAKTAGQINDLDKISLVDFILNHVVTYPYTVYKNIFQTPPATLTEEGEKGIFKIESYWLPEETNPFKDIEEAANALRNGLQGYINRITESMEEVAQFISAGEDSRALMGMIPNRLKRDAFIFLDNMNREGKIAQKAANAYGADFHPKFRSLTHYLDILEESSDLVGVGNEYTHSHSLRFEKTCNLKKYASVFGGFLSDTLLKGHHVKKYKGYGAFPFLPQKSRKHYSPIGARMGKAKMLFSNWQSVIDRQIERFKFIEQIRPLTGSEWFNMWPTSMHYDMPNLYCNRRLFRSYEVFMCKDVAKISAAVPTEWKLNRRLFNKAMRPYLKPTRCLFHADGRLPYFPWWINLPIQFPIWVWLQIAKRSKIIPNQGPWCDWGKNLEGNKWHQLVEKYSHYGSDLNEIINTNDKDLKSIIIDSSMTVRQKVNLMQTMYWLSKIT